MRRLLLSALLVIAASLVLPAPAALAHELCFAGKTPYCLADPFADYWEQNGGLPVFGYPIAAAAEDLNYDTGESFRVQWVERNRLEEHPEHAGTPYGVLLGLLGKERLAQLGRDKLVEPRESGQRAGCLWFAETGYNVCDQQPPACLPTADGRSVCAQPLGFKSYWESHGLAIPGLDKYARSLQLFGLPLAPARMETNGSGDTVLTQWFERARFEWHPGNPDSFKVLLGRLGDEIRGEPGRQLRQHWDQWSARGARNYEFVLELSCFCPPEYIEPVLITVRDGVRTSIVSVERGVPIDGDVVEAFARYDTVDKLFGLIDDAIKRDAAQITVLYDPDLGYPAGIGIDYERLIVDEELSLRVRRLELAP